MAEQRRLEQGQLYAFCHKLLSTIALGYEQYAEVIFPQDGVVSVVLLERKVGRKIAETRSIRLLLMPTLLFAYTAL
jgi:hypothetical protein